MVFFFPRMVRVIGFLIVVLLLGCRCGRMVLPRYTLLRRMVTPLRRRLYCPRELTWVRRTRCVVLLHVFYRSLISNNDTLFWVHYRVGWPHAAAGCPAVSREVLRGKVVLVGSASHLQPRGRGFDARLRHFSGMGPDPVHTMDLRMDFTTICTKILPVGTRRLGGLHPAWRCMRCCFCFVLLNC